MTKELVEAKNQEVSTEVATDLAAWGEQTYDNNDIIVPRVLVMQGLSEMVTDQKAKVGDFVDSLTEEVLGGFEDGLEIIPFHHEKVWRVQDGQDLVRIEPYVNDGRPWEEVVDGKTLKNFEVINIYCFVNGDLSLPYTISFKSTGLKIGRKIVTQMVMRNRADNIPPAGRKIELSTVLTSNGKNKYAALEAKAGERTTKEELTVALEWYKMTKSGQVQADESEAKEGSAPAEVKASDSNGDF